MKGIFKTFLAGCVFHIAVSGLYMDAVGKDQYLQRISEAWIPSGITTPFYLILLIGVIGMMANVFCPKTLPPKERKGFCVTVRCKRCGAIFMAAEIEALGTDDREVITTYKRQGHTVSKESWQVARQQKWCDCTKNLTS